MKNKLWEIASIQMGYSFRSRLESIDSGGVAAIQMKDLTDANRVNCHGLMRVDRENIKEHHLARTGDLIFRSRGQVMTSAILADDPGEAVVAAPLLRIRVNGAIVIPEYLNWFISQAPAQAFLISCAEGTAQKMISKQALEDLEVFIPSFEQQKMIIELAALAEEEKYLMENIMLKREKYLTRTLLNMAKGD
jgi:restriction endonuclease S subunit